MPDRFDEEHENEFANPVMPHIRTAEYIRAKESASALSRIARRVRRLETFDRFTAAGGAAGFDWGGIIVLHVDGSHCEYFDPSSSGLQNAIGASRTGDTIWTPACYLVGDFSIPTYVGLASMGRQTVINGVITLAPYSHLEGMEIDIEDTSAAALTGLYGPASGEAYLMDTIIQVHNTGAGNAYCATVAAGGNLKIMGCELIATADTGDGYAGRYLSGYLYVYDSRTLGSTSPFSPV